MQRFIVGILGLAAVLFGLNVLLSSQTGSSLPELLTGVVAEPSEAPAGARPGPAPTLPAEPAPMVQGTAAEALALVDAIRVTPVTRIPDYYRDAFGPSWFDVDGNGCDTRNDILARDLIVTEMRDSCTVLTGTLIDPYTGRTVDFLRGHDTSPAVQIDHLVSLSAAWRSGAHAWTDELRLQFANDPANLLAVDGPTNNSKGDKGPGMWLPSDSGNPGFDCPYAITYTNVLVKYELTAPAADLITLGDTLAHCI